MSEEYDFVNKVNDGLSGIEDAVRKLSYDIGLIIKVIIVVAIISFIARPAPKNGDDIYEVLNRINVTLENSGSPRPEYFIRRKWESEPSLSKDMAFIVNYMRDISITLSELKELEQRRLDIHKSKK